MSLSPKKWIPIIFAIKSSFKFPALATPNEVDRVMKDWWRMTSLQEYLRVYVFILLAWRPHCFANFSLFAFFCRREKLLTTTETVGGAVASWLARSTLERALRVRALAGDIVLCSWTRHFTLTVPLSTQVYKWVPANLMLGVTLRWTSIPSRGEYKYSQSLHATTHSETQTLFCTDSRPTSLGVAKAGT